MPLWLLRHAHTDWNGPPRRLQGRTDIGISDLGCAEAEALGRDFRRPDRIVTSPARRCLETIAAMFGERAPGTRRDGRLWEIDLGSFTGLSEDEAASRHGEAWREWLATPGRVRPGGGESLSEMQFRVAAAVAALATAIDDRGLTLVVTHGGPIRVLACAFEGLSLDQFHAIAVDNLACFAVTRRASGLRLDPAPRVAAPALTS